MSFKLSLSPKHILAGLLTSLTLAACSGGPAPLLNAASPQTPARVGAMSQPLLTQGSYQNFRIDPRLPVGKETRKAVKLTYMMADDLGHQSPWSRQMVDMIDDLPQRGVYNLVFRDGNETGDSRLWYMQDSDNDPKTVRAPQSSLATGVGEVQSNNPAVFSEVLRWSLDNYPAQHRYLQIYTHGGGLFGIGTDKVQTGPDGRVLPKEQQLQLMRPAQLNGALRQALRGRKLDLIYFRACLMGNLEALYELRGSVDYALASEDVSYSVDNSNLVMTRMFDELAAQGTAPRELARLLSIQALAQNSGPKMGYTTMAAIDINQLTELKSAINSLSLLLKAKLGSHGAQILAAYNAVPGFKQNDEAYPLRDFWAFGSELLQINDPQIQAAVLATRRAQEKATIHAKDVFGAKANGLSVLMPLSEGLASDKLRSYISKNYQENRFAVDSAWDDFLLALSDFVRAAGK